MLLEAPARDDPRLHHPPRHAVRRDLHGAGARASACRPDHHAERSAPSVEEYRQAAASKSDLDRTDLAKTKTGVFTGAYAINPVNDESIPVWIADYVLMGYGTGAIMAVPGHDERDFEFAQTFDLPIVRVVAPSWNRRMPRCRMPRPSPASRSIRETTRSRSTACPRPRPRSRSPPGWKNAGSARRPINYKLRDWLFSRQRYWGEPFPVVLDDRRSHPVRFRNRSCRSACPSSKTSSRPASPSRRLSKAKDWVKYSEKYSRARPTRCRSGPARAGITCATSTRTTTSVPWDPEKEQYWLPVDLYVGGAEHAVLHLLYSRFWHKVLFDRGLVSTAEPFQKLINQGMILGETEYTAYRDAEGRWARPGRQQAARDVVAVKLSEDQVVKKGEGFVLAADPGVRVDARAHKMSKARGNVINPDAIVAEYGADSLRLYEMFMGPLEAVKPWSMKGVEGVYRFLGRAWRMIVDAEADVVRLDPRVKPVELSPEQAKVVARTIAAVTDDLEAYPVQHGHQPVDGVCQLLHVAGSSAHEGDGNLHALARPDGASHGRGALVAFGS